MASPTGKAKGKGRTSESNEVDQIAYFEPADGDPEESGTTADYETALESALYDQRSSSTHQHHKGSNGHASNGDEEEEDFIYDGKDDDDTNMFREDAKLDSLDYKDRLHGVLGDSVMDELGDYDEGLEPATPQVSILSYANGPSMSTPPRSPSGSTYSLPHSPSTVRRRSQAHESMNNPTSPHHLQQRPLPPSQPFPRPRALPSSIPSPSSSARSSTFLLDSSQMVASPSSSRFGSMPMRRPPMNPLVSRLRSISATPSQSFRGVRSSSQASSLASLAIQDTEGLHGFADDSHAYSLDQSLILSSNNNGHVPISNGSRRSSTSNLKTVARGGFDMSPSASSNAQNGDDAEATLLHPERRKGSHLPTAHELVPPLKWTVLKRLSQRLFSDPLNNGKSSSSLADAGSPTCLAVAGGLIVIGTSKGWTMVYDYSQSLKAIAGNDDISKQCGEVTALALSQDATFIAVAYRSAHIHLYEWGRKPGTPARTVQPTTLQAINSGKAEGHLAKDASGSGSVIWHLGFVGRRHTAIVSGDHYGLAFYHSLGKVLGLANTDILRILGKYPFDLGPGLRTGLDGEAVTPLPPSRLLGVQSLPLGTEEHWVDEFNLIALLTGGKLVIAGLKPTPRTWWRYVNHTRSSQNDLNTHAFSSQSSEADEDMLHHGNGDKDTESQSGCLAWLPSIDGSSPLLAWCWQGALRIAKVEPGHSGQSSALRAAPPRESRKSDALRPAQNGMSDTRITPTFQVLTRKLRAKESHAKQAVNTSEVLTICDETMKALQWLNKRVLACLTTTRIVLFDVESLEVVEESRHFGADFAIPRFSSLQQSFKAYKGKLFYLTGNDIRAGSVLSWADRVLHLVNLGQLVRAIDLLVFYYSAEDSTDANVEMLPLATLDLPKDRIDRQAIVEPKLREILAASVDYAFSEQRMKNEAAFYQNGATHGIDSTEFFENLVDAFIRASLAIKSFEFLFDNLAERYFEHGIEGIFLDRLKPYILSGQIKSMPVSISQQLIARCAAGKQMREVEDLIWHIDPQSLDVNQAVSLCSKSHLYEALIHVYTRALQDFVGPLVELVSLIAQIVRGRSTSPWHAVESVSNASSAGTSKDDLDALVPGAYTVFSYLADSFVGLAHPSQEPLQTEVALNAKITLYKFLFSSSLQVYPPGSDALVRTTSEGTSIYPYLYLLLLFDAEATLDCMDIAMEDSYLDEDAAAFGTPDRQSVITAFLTILNNPESRRNLSYGDQTFVNIFIARNLPKYSQFVKLEAETMHQILVHLANDADLSTHQDRELAVEYLLSSYSPAYDAALLQLLEDARFFEVLASIYRSQKAWPRLASVYLKNNDSGPEIFSRLSLVLEKAEADDKAQLEVVKAEILASTPQLINEGVTEFASLIEQKMPEAHTAAVQALQEAPLRQMAYLRSLLEPHMDADSTQPLGQASQHVTENLRYMYVALLAQFDPPSVLRYLDNEPSLDRSKIIDICKERGNFEAVVWIQASHGEVAASLQTARSVLESQGESVIRGLLSREYSPITQRALNNVIDVGKAAMQVAGKACTGDLPAEFATAEDIWYGVLSCLIDTVRDITRNLRTMDTNDLSGECTNEIARVSQLVPDAISVLISSTFAETLALPHLVRRLMDNSRESTYADYKGILDSMLDTYRFEGDLLSTSKRLLELDVHGQVAELVKARGTGWRPGRSGLCEACGRSVWTKTNEKERLSNPRLVVQSASEVEVSEKLKLRPRVRRRPSLKGKETDWYEEEAPKTNHGGPSSQSLVVFRGGAVCHAECLEQGGKR